MKAATLLVVSSVSGKTTWDQLDNYSFDAYISEYGRTYGSAAERAERASIFAARLDVIRAHNAESNPPHSWRRGVNAFTDRLPAELRAMKGLDKALLHAGKAAEPLTTAAEELLRGLPASVDWRLQKAVTPVKNQGQCGSCWTFASAETLESHWFLATGELQELSEQFILDCTPNDQHCGGDGGCAGGTAKLAYDRLAAVGGCPSEWTYPYLSGLGKAGTCHGLPLPPAQPHSAAPARAANVTGHVAVMGNSYPAVMNAIATKGPLAVTVDAGAWHDYESGVFDGGNATNPDLDHLVQMVGYGTDADTGADYFLIRNSWTPGWGEDGYIRLARSVNASCGVDITPLDGDGCAGGPATVEVCGQSGVLFDAVYPIVV